MSAEVKSMKEWALYYAELGLAVFPLAYLKLLEHCEECLRIFFLRDYLMILKMITN